MDTRDILSSIESALKATGNTDALNLFWKDKAVMATMLGQLAQGKHRDEIVAAESLHKQVQLASAGSPSFVVTADRTSVGLLLSGTTYAMNFHRTGDFSFMSRKYQYSVLNIGLAAGAAISVLMGMFSRDPEDLVGNDVNLFSFGGAYIGGAVLNLYIHERHGTSGWLIGLTAGAEVQVAGVTVNGSFQRYEKKWYSFLPGF